jgi:hypothetical protein
MAAITSEKAGHEFAGALHSDGPAADHAEQMQLYGQFVGAWDGEVWFVDEDGSERTVSAEAQFGWTLQGRAVQDVWIAPARSEPNPPRRMYGSTTRVYNPERDDWEITWIDPGLGQFERQRGKRVGDDIVQESRGDDGSVTQWIFTDIEPDSFRWLSRRSDDGGQSWRKLSEYRFRRRAA